VSVVTLRSASALRAIVRWASVLGRGLLATVALSCVSVGEGSGRVVSDHLFARECWDDAYDLRPDFFGADAFRGAIHMRIQRGSDLLEVSDGVVVLVDDVEEVRARLGEPIPVTLPAGVAPPGRPVGSLCETGDCSSPVHLALYLLESCHNQNVVLYATSGTVTFEELFSGDPNEDQADDKLTVARFDVTVMDPRDLPNDDDAPAPATSRLVGSFRFLFQRGQPAQPFP
jgi:hypothetical protein